MLRLVTTPPEIWETAVALVPPPPTIQIASPPPGVTLSPTVLPVMRLDSANLAPYDNYQIQFKPDIGGAWENWDGGLFSPTDVTNSQYLFITNGVGFFRLRYVP